MSVRDITINDTFDMKFTTRAFATGIPTTMTGTPTIEAYPGNSTTQITAGITLTFTSGFDSVAGLCNVRVVATTGNGYAADTDYALVIAGTAPLVDSVSVLGEVVGHFSTSRSAAAVDLANGTDGLGAIKAETALILTDTAEIGSAGAGLTAVQLAAAGVDAIWDELMAGHVTVDSAGLVMNDWQDAGRLDVILDAVATPAQVNTEVLDVLNVDTFGEPAQGAPGATVSIQEKIAWLYKFLRNKKTSTATTISLFNDDTTTVDTKRTISDDATTYTEGELATGP